SGCTAGEAESWGKVTADGIAAMAFVDATIGLPLLAGAVLGRNSDQPERAKRAFRWNSDKLEAIGIE
ncbi:MAG: deoxyhypusine synthase family protein, partial [Planctomycetota bacterium]